MTALIAREGSCSLLAGRTSRIGSDWVFCSFRLPTSMPIPLAVISPVDVELATWAFTGMRAPAHQPTCLLLVRPHSAAAATAIANGTELVLRTHFRDIAIATGPAEGASHLSSGERAVAARAVLSSIADANVAALADPITLLLPDLHFLPEPTKGLDLTISNATASSCTLSGADVPNFILFKSDVGTRCARVAAARLTFSPNPLMDLDLEPVWGPDAFPPARAILIGHRRFRAVRVPKIAA